MSEAPDNATPESATAGPGPGPLVVVAAVTILCLIWGSTWLVIKTGLQELPVLMSAAARFTMAATVLAMLAPVLSRHEGGIRPTWRLTLSMGLLSFAIPYGIVYTVETVLPSGLTSVLWAVFPMMTAALSHRWLPGERLRPRQWVGLLLGLGGVAVLFATDLTDLGPEAVTLGALLLLSPLASAAGQVIVKRQATKTSAILLNRNGTMVGATVLWLGALPFETLPATLPSTGALLGVVYLALVGTVVTFGLYFWLLRYVSANRMSLIAYVTPAIALWLGWAVGNEPLAASTIGGSALIGVGIVLAMRR